MNDKKLELNEEKLIKMLLIHEFGEIDAGDITPYDNKTKLDKFNMEKEGVLRVAGVFGQDEYYKLWHEFEENKTPEAKLAKIVDKLDAVLQAKYYSIVLNKPELFEEFYNSSKEIIEEYIEYI